MFKCYRKLKKHAKRREKTTILGKVDGLVYRNQVKLAHKCMKVLAGRGALKRQYQQLRERCQLK